MARRDRPDQDVDGRPLRPGPATTRVARQHRRDIEHADPKHPVAAGEEHRAGGRLARPSRRVSRAMASAISQVRGARIIGHVAGSMQWIGQSQSANET